MAPARHRLDEDEFMDEQVAKVQRMVLGEPPDLNPSSAARWKACATAYANDGCVRRYLRTRNWVASRAALSIEKTIKWRLDHGLDQGLGSNAFLAIPAAPTGEGEGIGKGKERESTPGMRLSPGRDLLGRPVLVMTVRGMAWADPAGWMKDLINALEQASRSLSATSSDSWLWLVDLSGCSLLDVPPPSALERLTQTLRDHYPGRLEQAVLIDPPGFFWLAYAFVEKLLDPGTRAKVVLVDRSKGDMGRFISEDQLEEAFGGRIRVSLGKHRGSCTSSNCGPGTLAESGVEGGPEGGEAVGGGGEAEPGIVASGARVKSGIPPPPPPPPPPLRGGRTLAAPAAATTTVTTAAAAAAPAPARGNDCRVS